MATARAKPRRRTVPQHASVCLDAVSAMIDREDTAPEKRAELEAARKWLRAKLKPGGAWPGR